MTLTTDAGEAVADKRYLPEIEDLILEDPADDPLTRFAADPETILALCVKYAVADSGAGVEARWLMGSDSIYKDIPNTDPKCWSKRVRGLRGFLQMESARVLRSRLEASVEWANALNGLSETSRSLVKAKTVLFDDLPAYIAALRLMLVIIDRYTEMREDLDARRREVTDHPEWPSAKYLNLGDTVIEILETDIPAEIDAVYFTDLEAAISMATEKIRSIGQTSEPGYTGRPGPQNRPGPKSRSAARRRAGERDARPNPEDRSGRRGGGDRRRRRGLTTVAVPFAAPKPPRGVYSWDPVRPG